MSVAVTFDVPVKVPLTCSVSPFVRSLHLPLENVVLDVVATVSPWSVKLTIGHLPDNESIFPSRETVTGGCGVGDGDGEGVGVGEGVGEGVGVGDGEGAVTAPSCETRYV